MGHGSFSAYPLGTSEVVSSLLNNWDELAKRVGDVYYETPYLEVASLSEQGQIFLGLYESPGGMVIYPFVLRPLSALPFDFEISGAQYDIVSVFEYGGPLTYVPERTDINEVRAGFIAGFSDYCRSMGVVCEFVRFNPILRVQDGWEGFYELSLSRANVFINLVKTPEMIMSGYSASTRRNVRLAEKRGVQVERAESTEQNIRSFIEVYHRTMAKVEAPQYYYFSEAYFRSLARLGDELVSLYLARNNSGSVIGAAFFIHGKRYAHYHLSGTISNVRRLYPNNLLLHTAAVDMRQTGRQYLHLGGAAPDQKGLLAFKEGFSKERQNYYVGRRVHDHVAYDALCSAWAEVSGKDRYQANMSFFPLYRS